MSDAETAAPVTVLLVDDHPLMRGGLRVALEREPDLTVVGEAGDGVEALEQIALLQPQIAIMDVDMPRMGGFDVVRELNRLGSAVAAIMLTLHNGRDLLVEALDLGVRGYVLKSSAVTDIAEGVRRVALGGSYLSQDVQGILACVPGDRNSLPKELQALTPIELKIVQHVARGDTSREIGLSLELSARTIENYRSAICLKLDLTGPNALLHYALTRQEILRRR